jgi:DNA processing protein
MIALLNIPKMTRKIAEQIMNLTQFNFKGYDSFKDILYMSKKYIKNMPEISDEIIKLAFYKADEILRDSQNQNIIAMARHNPQFPKKLLYIPNAPLIIYAKGNLACLNSKYSAAVIGTRNPSVPGESLAKKLGYEFADRGITVVSGLAIGCDKMAHEGAIEARGNTIAVLGNGLDSIYPKQNTKLAYKILGMNGCLISEYPIGETVKKSHLIERDRLQSGLSDGIVVVETGTKGGTMHTVNFALKQGKLVSIIKYPNEFLENEKSYLQKIDSKKITGNQKLILEEKGIEIHDYKSFENFILKLSENNNNNFYNQVSQVSFF